MSKPFTRELIKVKEKSANMFKSSFAQEVLLDSRANVMDTHFESAMMPSERHTLYKSQFAASTHGPLDNLTFEDDTDKNEDHNGNAIVRNKFRRRLESRSSMGRLENDQQDLLQTSDLGASDFSSSELWPGSASPSPFHYSQR